MKKNGKLTIGVISKNGEPFIEDCLESLSLSITPLSDYFRAIDFILVDSNSSDNTLRVMLNFAKSNTSESVTTDVYLIEGYCNSSIARNIILENCTGDLVFLCDGDITVDSKFLISASKKITGGQADAVVGMLAEKWFDADYKFYKSIPVRKQISHNQTVRVTGGMIILSKRVVQSGIKFDERLVRSEDRDFSLRISDKFKILGISECVGTHLTQPYYSKERFGIFIKENYNKYIGMLFRKHMFSLRNLCEIANVEKGVMLGFLYIASLITSLTLFLLQIYVPFFVTLAVVIVDFIRHLKKHPANRFIMNRFISPIMATQGFFFPQRNIGSYSVKKVN